MVGVEGIEPPTNAGYNVYSVALPMETTRPLPDQMVQAERVELPESFKTMRLQRIPLPLRDKLAFEIGAPTRT
jgi:hypothetical protein